jgi:OFA family oxalate/formate antiporter-like MFS transporter
MSAGFLVCANTSSLLGIYLAYGVVCSLGVGLVYNAVLSTVVKWFPDKPALCSGILLMGFGAGGFLLGTVASRVIDYYTVINAFIVFAVICIVVLMLASFLIFAPKENEVIHTNKKTAQPTEDIQAKDMIKTRSFRVAFMWGMFSSACALAVIGQASAMAETALEMSKIAAGFVVGVISVSSGVGRVIMGLIYARLSKKTLMICISALFSLSAVLLAVAIKAGVSVLVYPGVFLLGYAYGSVPSFGVSIIREFYGTKNYSVNMSVFNIHLIFSALIGSSLTGFVFGKTGDYMHIILLTFILSAIAILCASFMKPKLGAR